MMAAQAGFPVDKLVPVQGCIRALVFADPQAGAEQDLYWGIDIEFAPLRYRGERVKPSLSCDWMLIDIRDWKSLEGAALEGDYDRIEASFHVWEPDFAQNSRIQFLERDGASFRVRYEMVVDFSGVDEADEDPNLTVTAELTLPYLGFHVDSEILEGRPGNEEKAKELAARYVDLSCYREPRIENGVFQFDPAV